MHGKLFLFLAAVSLTLTASASDKMNHGPTGIKKRVGVAGSFYVGSNVGFGIVKTNQTIIRLPATPQCVLQVGPIDTPQAFGGTLTIAGDAVGQPGGFEAPIEITPPPSDAFYGIGLESGAFYLPATGQRVTARLQGTSSIPKSPLMNVRSPLFTDVVRVAMPIPTETGEVVVNAADGLILKWNVPAGPIRNQKLIATLFSFSSESMIGEIRCGFNLASGSAKIPSKLMLLLRNFLGSGPAGGFIHVRTGGFQIVNVPGATYTLEVTDAVDTDFAAGADTYMTIQ